MHEIIYKLKSHFEREVQSLRNEIENATQLLLELRKYCREQCEHEWRIITGHFPPDFVYDGKDVIGMRT